MPTFQRRSHFSPNKAYGKRVFFKREKPTFPTLADTSPKKDEAPKPAHFTPPIIETPTIPEVVKETDELVDINKLIKESSARLSGETSIEEEVVEETKAKDPIAFEGLNNGDKKIELLEAELEAERKRALELSKQIEEIEKDTKKEKKHLTREVDELRQEIHRTAPLNLEGNKFFTISKELRDAVKTIDELKDELSKDSDVSVSPVAIPSLLNMPIAEVASPKEVKKNETVEATPTAPKAPISKQKMMITGGAAIAVLLLLSGFLSWKLVSDPSVDKKIVDDYTKSKSGQVAGVNTTNTAAGNQTEDNNKWAESQASVSFAESKWETVRDPIIGASLEYPSNATNIIKTDNSLTFIRKTGYIFKIQKIETALELEEYWKQIKATSLGYTETVGKFKDKKALFLQLTDISDYPGNRYLVKIGEYIYDVWYATSGGKFDENEVLRAQKMLETLTIAVGQ